MNFSFEKIIKLIRKHFLLILAVALLCSVGMYYYKKHNSTPVYTAYTEMRVNTVLTEEGKEYASINTERNYVSTYIEILKTYNYSEYVRKDLLTKYPALSAGEVFGSLNISQKNDTEIIVVRVYNTNRELAVDIANAVEESAQEYLHDLFSVASVGTVEDARFAGVSSVSYKKSVIIGFAFGALLAFFAVFVKDLYDYRLRSVSEIKERYNLPVLGAVPTFDSKSTARGGKYKYNYRNKNDSKR